MIRLSFILIFLILIACNPIKDGFYMSDDNYLENSRIYSPDSSMILLNYCSDWGALGSGESRTAILKLADTTKNLQQYSLPTKMINVKWIDNKSVSAQIDIIPLIRSNSKIHFKDTMVNAVKVKVSGYDYIDSTDCLEIVKRESSPNGLYEMVAYRYSDKYNLNFIHVSVITKGAQIPKYGNYFIADMQDDVINDGTWNNANELNFYSSSDCSDLMKYYLVKGRPKINYHILVDSVRFGTQYRWMKKSGL